MTTGLIQYAVLLPILYLGIVTSIEDYRYGKIYRRHIALGLAVGISWYVMLGLFYWLGLAEPTLIVSIIPRIFLATLIALLVSGGMWWFNVWSAADAKLFTVFTLLMPIAIYEGRHNDIFASFVLLVNAYTVAFVVITGDFLIRLTRLTHRKLVRYRSGAPETRAEMSRGARAYLIENIPGWFKSFLGFTFILMIVRTLRNIVREELAGVITIDDTLMFLALFLAFHPLHRAFQIRAIAVAVVAGLAAFIGFQLYKDPTGQTAMEIVSVGVLALALITFRQVYTFWSKLVEVVEIPISQLSEHMIVSESTLEALKHQEVLTEDDLKELGVEGLNAEFAQRIRELYHNDEQPGLIQIEKTIPFAPFLFAGLIATFFLHDVIVRF